MRDYFDMVDEMGEVEKQRRFRLLEATTMDAVTYLPTNMGMVRAKIKDLARKKWKWGLEILEDDNGNKDLRIENVLRIIVPEEHWESFQEMFTGTLDQDSYLNLSELLNEALVDDLEELRDDLKPALYEMYNSQVFTSLDKTIKVWRGYFGVDQVIVDKHKVAVISEYKGRDIQKLAGELLRAYGDDKGDLEMLLSDMQSKRPLGAYDIFKKYDYLYGSRTVSDFEGITLVFEAYVDMAFMISESIYVNDDEILDEVEDQITTVKRVGNVLYPVGEKFDVDFFNTLQNIIEDASEEIIGG